MVTREDRYVRKPGMLIYDHIREPSPFRCPDCKKQCRTIIFRLSETRWALFDNDENCFGIKNGSEQEIEEWFLIHTCLFSAAPIKERGADRRAFRDHIADLKQRLSPGEGENPNGAWEGPRTYAEAVEMSDASRRS